MLAHHAPAAGRRDLATGCSPVIDEQDAITGAKHRTSDGEVQVTISIVRSRPLSPPLVVIRSALGSLPNLREADTKMGSHQRAQQAPTRLGTEHHGGTGIGKERGESWAQFQQDVGVAPPQLSSAKYVA